MNQENHHSGEWTSGGLSTEELADAIGMRPDSIRVHLCRRGSYYGIRPARLANGRLLWPADSVDRLVRAH